MRTQLMLFPFRLSLAAAGLLVAATSAVAQPAIVSGPPGSSAFGATVTVLPNGNYVVTDPHFDQDSMRGAGAVYLYDGTTHALLNTLTGNYYLQEVGSGGIQVLANGNYVVSSPGWNRAGAATWGSSSRGTAGGVVSAANSVVGSKFNDKVGEGGIVALPNGNYLVVSSEWQNGEEPRAGAVTWGNGQTGTAGVVSAANSLVGTVADSYVGDGFNEVLPNGNYVVSSSHWSRDQQEGRNIGAATWGNGRTGVVGAVSAANSLVGSTPGDCVSDGYGGIVVLANGHYVVSTARWDHGPAAPDVGAVTWCDGAAGRTGTVSAANSLVGSAAGDLAAANSLVGSAAGDLAYARVLPLANGHYVVGSPGWDNGPTAPDVGAVTWCDGTAGRTGAVSAANSLVGAASKDQAGREIVPLANSNYLISTGNAGNFGAVTWCDGLTGRTGTVSAANSLVGSAAGDLAYARVLPLTNGHYVVGSPGWDNGPGALDAGAATWCDGRTGRTGTVSATTSLTGSTAGDEVGANTLALPNGNYVISSPEWDHGTSANAGAATWGNGTTGTAGAVSARNSLVGITAFDHVGNGTLTALANGNYVVHSSGWNGPAAPNAGAVTWGNGQGGTVGAVSAANSLVGSAADDRLGYTGQKWGEASQNGIRALANGSYLVASPYWDHGAVANAGAVTWGDGHAGTTGTLSAANSLVGAAAGTYLGLDDYRTPATAALPDGNYLVRGTGQFPADSAAGACTLTLASGRGGTVGPGPVCSSLVAADNPLAAYQPATATLLVGLPEFNQLRLLALPPPAPTGAARQRLPRMATVAGLQASGAAVRWYAVPAGGAALDPATPLARRATYYASQTVGGCESPHRLAVGIKLTWRKQ